MTAGLLIWAAHFLGLYLLASAALAWLVVRRAR